MAVEIIRVDYHNAEQAQALSHLMNCYAQDPMGGGQALSQEVRANLASALARIEGAVSVMCYVDGKAVGLINCFAAFSTFKCQPLINIHDVVVLQNHRGQGLCRKMLDEVQLIAGERGCCKITLEVLSGNEAAKLAYQSFGFGGYELDPSMGGALFWQKELL